MTELQRSDFHAYLRSLAEELDAVQNRVRLLVKHWLTDGHFKEMVLRNFLRKYLPESVLIGTGFVVSSLKPSGEIDILIVDRNMPTLFKEGDLLIVTPESVRAIIEVKTRLPSPGEITEAIQSLAERKKVATSHVSNADVWAGLFVFNADELDRHQEVLKSLFAVSMQTGAIIDSVAFGDSTFIKYFKPDGVKYGVWPDNAWHSFHASKAAPAFFLASLLEHLAPKGRDHGSFAWDALPPDGERRFIQIRKSGETAQRLAEWIKRNPKPPLKVSESFPGPATVAREGSGDGV